MIKVITFYQKYISPYKGRSYCNFVPTCSVYAVEAIERFGALKGGFMAFKRIMKCNPFHKGGYDPVPFKRVSKKDKNSEEQDS
jgi:putative membrane protein insertion efficiency factor